MESEVIRVTDSLKKLFLTASDIYVDTENKECEAKISVDEFRGEITERLYESGFQFLMVDYWDTYPFKYVFQYSPAGANRLK
jgi:hypothetical protein